MKTLEDFKNEVVQEYNYDNWEQFEKECRGLEPMQVFLTEAATLYGSYMKEQGREEGLSGGWPDDAHPAYRTWLQQAGSEQKHYPTFKNAELNNVVLFQMWKAGKTPTEALNDLITAT